MNEESFKNSLSRDEKRWMLRGMITTRAVDNCLKRLFISGEIQYEGKSFQGKGFRSFGQEAIYAAALRLNKGPLSDIVAPLIRDLGVVLAFTEDDIDLALNAQAGKDGLPMGGRDLHLGDLSRGVLPAAAPLTISTCTVTGMAFAMKLKSESRIGVSFIGEGGTSLGEWHEAINLAACRKLPMIFCVQNNQRALSTSVSQQSAVKSFADKAIGYGIDCVSVDGTDPEAIAWAFSWGAERARCGEGPVLIEVVSMRMCGHAHHDDMLYLGKDPVLSFELPKPSNGGYVDVELYEKWAKKDPIKNYSAKLIKEKIATIEDVENWKTEAVAKCEAAVERIKARPWPRVTTGVFAQGSPSPDFDESKSPSPLGEGAGSTYLEAIAQGVADVMSARSNVIMLGEDVAAPYGNAFMMFKSIMDRFSDRFYNMPIAEGAIIGACVGLALEGMRPIGEMQFNDFVASGFNELVNNAAKFYYRVGKSVPMVLRMPWGGLRHAGPFHSQDTISWFYRTAGLKIVVPSTPYDARALLNAAVADDNPVLFYEHIALYRDPSIRQVLGDEPGQIPIGKAALRHHGNDLTMISYGAYVHKATRCADILQTEEGVNVDLIDLRSLVPLDFELISDSVKRTGRVLLVGEDSKRGSVLESIASQISEQLFEYLDAPVYVRGSLDTPVPYSPPLEHAYLLSPEQILSSARELLSY